MSYLGLKFRNPLIVSSCDLTGTESGILQCEEAGAGGVVLKSLFEEQFILEEGVSGDYDAIFPEAHDYLRRGALLEYAPHDVVRLIERVKKRVQIPVIASINCRTPKLWPKFARQIQDAGADALELNIYVFPADTAAPGSVYEEHHLQILKEVKKAVSIPVSVKLTSQITSLPYLGERLAAAGCDGLVFFNWFLESDIDVKHRTTRSLKGKGNLYQSLRWVALLSGRLGCDIASSGGIEKSDDVVKQLLAGASSVQVCTLLHRKGLKEIQNLLRGLEIWMKEHRYSSVEEFQGELSFRKQELSFKNSGEAQNYLRAQYLKTYSKM